MHEEAGGAADNFCRSTPIARTLLYMVIRSTNLLPRDLTDMPISHLAPSVTPPPRNSRTRPLAPVMLVSLKAGYASRCRQSTEPTVLDSSSPCMFTVSSSRSQSRTETLSLRRKSAKSATYQGRRRPQEVRHLPTYHLPTNHLLTYYLPTTHLSQAICQNNICQHAIYQHLIYHMLSANGCICANISSTNKSYNSYLSKTAQYRQYGNMNAKMSKQQEYANPASKKQRK